MYCNKLVLLSITYSINSQTSPDWLLTTRLMPRPSKCLGSAAYFHGYVSCLENILTPLADVIAFIDSYCFSKVEEVLRVHNTHTP